MTSGRFLLAFLILPFAAVARAESPGDAALNRLAWLVGGSWHAEAKTPDGKPLAITFKVEWAGHRKALRYSITFRAGEQTFTNYEGSYWYDPAAKQIRMWQIDRGGNVTDSTLTFDGDLFKQQNTVTKADGTTGKQRVEFQREGEDAFTFRAQVPQGEQWVKAVEITYKRTSN